MASRRAPRAGFNPALGHVDPQTPHAQSVADTQITHYPHLNGAVCNFRPVPTDPASYDANDPTCEKCAAWLKAAKANTAARHPWTKEG